MGTDPGDTGPIELTLVCPQCGEKVEKISYSVNFILIDGVRYRTNATWDVHHDDLDGNVGICQFFDGERTVGTETPSGVLWEWDPEDRVGRLRDLQSGEIVLQWREPEREGAPS